MEDMSKAIEGIVTGIGAIAEMTKIAYDAFCKAGFAGDDALYLAGEFMTCTIDKTGGK